MRCRSDIDGVRGGVVDGSHTIEAVQSAAEGKERLLKGCGVLDPPTFLHVLAHAVFVQHVRAEDGDASMAGLRRGRQGQRIKVDAPGHHQQIRNLRHKHDILYVFDDLDAAPPVARLHAGARARGLDLVGVGGLEVVLGEVLEQPPPRLRRGFALVPEQLLAHGPRPPFGCRDPDLQSTERLISLCQLPARGRLLVVEQVHGRLYPSPDREQRPLHPGLVGAADAHRHGRCCRHRRRRCWQWQCRRGRRGHGCRRPWASWRPPCPT
mmetsp:Transcript_23624/g.62291  ORF Transcript_23624/g.62291 Transcript_23624/m.62291 type:complete len:266 (+) Transcript_23624:977-1774(+)